MLVVFGTRGSRAPLTAVPGTCARIAVLEPVAQGGEARRLGGQLRRAPAAPRRPSPAIAGHVLRAGAPVALVLAAGQDRR